MLEYLKAIRGAVERTEQDIKDMKFRLGQLENKSLSIQREQSNVYGALTHQTERFDRIDERLNRIEKRLDPVESWLSLTRPRN